MHRIAAIATAYYPDERLLAVIEAARSVCVELLIVDNTPGGAPLLAGELPAGVRVLRPAENLGLAGALNLGLRGLSSCSDAVLLLDQDSAPTEELITKLVAHLDDPTVGMAAPAPWDVERGSYLDPRSVLRPEIADRDAVITSGTLVRRSLLDELHGFRQDFFVDCVDQDFCLRARRAGKRIVQDRRLLLPHSLGDVREHRFLVGHVRVTHHPTWRLYWVVRNGTVLVRENIAAVPLWSLTSILIMVRWALLTALYERPRGTRLAAMWRGLLDGLRGRTDHGFLPVGASTLTVSGCATESCRPRCGPRPTRTPPRVRTLRHGRRRRRPVRRLAEVGQGRAFLTASHPARVRGDHAPQRSVRLPRPEMSHPASDYRRVGRDFGSSYPLPRRSETQATESLPSRRVS